jgi:hypothetical protein
MQHMFKYVKMNDLKKNTWLSSQMFLFSYTYLKISKNVFFSEFLFFS